MAEIPTAKTSLAEYEMPGPFEAVRGKELSAVPEGSVYLNALRQLFDLRTGEAGT
jgi:hypothetical protein